MLEESTVPEPETAKLELEALLTLKEIEATAESISRIIDEPIGENLIRVRPKGTRRNWQAAMDLGSVVLRNEVKNPEGEKTKPYEHKIDVIYTPEAGDPETTTMNARMVGQIIQKLAAFTEISRVAQDHNDTDKAILLEDARDILIQHIKVATDKHRRAETTLSSGEALRKTLDRSGMTPFQGVDKASPDQLVHLIRAIRQRGDNTTEEQKTQNNQQLHEKNIILPEDSNE